MENENVTPISDNSENENIGSSSEENFSEDVTTQESSSEEVTTDDNSYHAYLIVDEDLTEFDFEERIPDEPTLYDINYNVLHIYNLLLLLTLFLIGKWLIDKVCIVFEGIWKKY